MPFKSNDPNHPSKNRLRKRTRKLSRNRHTAYTPTRRNAILQSIAKGVGVAEACRNAGVLDRTAPARWVKQSDPLVASTPGRKKKLDDTDRSVIIYKLVEKQPFIPVVVLTGTNNEIVGNQAIKAGAQDFLVKGEFDSISILQFNSYLLFFIFFESLLPIRRLGAKKVYNLYFI